MLDFIYSRWIFLTLDEDLLNGIMSEDAKDIGEIYEANLKVPMRCIGVLASRSHMN